MISSRRVGSRALEGLALNDDVAAPYASEAIVGTIE